MCQAGAWHYSKNHKMKKSLLLATIFLLINTLQAQTSTFDNDNEGWFGLGDSNDAPCDWVPINGNPDGYAQVVDQSIGGVWYFQAPKKFLGNKCPAYGQKLQFDLKTSTLTGGYDQDDVYLRGNGIVIVFNFPNNPGFTWTHYEVKLDETANWRINTINGVKATKSQIVSVLANVDLFKIRGEFAKGTDDIGGLDNVIFPDSPIAFDLDADNSSKALLRDFNSDTICGTNARFRICDSDLSLNFGGTVDSIVITEVNNSKDFVFTTNGFNSASITSKGNNSPRLRLTSKIAGDSIEMKKALLLMSGIAIKTPKPPTVIKISVKVYLGECSISAICNVFIINNLIFDLDKNNSTGALGNDYNGDTLCIKDNNFRICDSDLGFGINGVIDSIVIAPAPNDFSNYKFTNTITSPSVQVQGANTNHFVLLDKNANDSSELKKVLIGLIGTLPNGIKPPTTFKIKVKVYQGECEVEAIATIHSIIRVTIGTPVDTVVCNYDKPLDLFILLKGNDVQIGEWSPKLNSGGTFFDPKLDKSGVYQYRISGSQGCPSDSVSVKIDLVTVPTTLLGKDTLICIDSARTISVAPIFDKYKWQDNTNSSTYTVSQGGRYYVTASLKGCTVTDTLNLTGINCKKCQFYAPNAISADNNGTNDDFHLYSDCLPKTFLLRIFNRWGDLMFETTDFNAAWDGKFKGKEQVQGIYIYYAEIETEYKNKPFYEKKKGDFMLMR